MDNREKTPGSGVNRSSRASTKKKKQAKERRRQRLALALTALVLFLAVMIWLAWSIWGEYRGTIVRQQEEQMMQLTRSVTDSMSSMIDSSSDDLNILCSLDALFKTEEETSARQELLFQEAAKIIGQEKDFVTNIMLTAPDGKTLGQLRQQQFKKNLFETAYTKEIKLTVQLDENGYTYLILERAREDGCIVKLVVDLMKYYKSLISSIRFGNNGYLLAKTSDGLIIMHPSKEQLGLDVIEGRKELFDDVDLKDLEQMVEKQKKGEEGISVYHSYWWTDEDLPRVKKIAAYTPLLFSEDFFIISSVIDYDDIYGPIEQGVARISVMLFIIFAGIAALLLAVTLSLRGKEKDRREIVYLKELNATLEEMQRSEDRIAHQQRLQIIGTMTSGIAHEFNNLLTPIMGYAGMMLAEAPEDSENYQDIKEIYDASEKAKEIIQQISSLSRKNMETAFRYVTAKKMLNRSLKMVRSVCPENIRLIEEIHLSGEGFLGNETQMNQVMLNLCVNGFHAIGRDEGTMTICATVVETARITENHPELPVEELFKQYIRIRISDTGSGMTKETMAQIFNPFFTTKQTGQGTGLGLTIVDNILVSHRGLITVDSREGAGSTFTIYLPVSRESDLALEKPEAVKEISGVSLLIVDNNPKVLRLLERGFKKLDIEADICPNPSDALGMLKAKAYDFLMTDFYMSGSSGLSIAIAARGIRPGIRIIMTTGVLQKEIIEAKKEHVIDGYLEKPVACQQIVKMMMELLE